ncbi:MAG: ShlB/FhaC/HecB family hemolysin secretion/activation protein [Pseudobdellovibrionaceae bacterium]
MTRISRLLKASATTGCALLSLAPAAYAQSIPGAADAGRVDQNLKQGLPKVARQAPLNVTGNAPFTAPAGAEKLTFTLEGIELEGMSVYSTKEITPLYANKINQKISLADVYAIAAQMTAKYRNDGYILTQVVVPPQTISGNVKLRVVEGKIDKVGVEGSGAQGSNGNIIRDYVSELQKHTVLNNSDLERTLLLINDLPGVTARSILSPSKTVTGASDLTIVVERKAMDGTAQLNNFGSEFLGPLQILGGFNLNSWFGHNERVSAQVAYAPQGEGIDSELVYGELSAAVPITKYGTLLEGNFGASNTDPGHTLEPFDVKGKSRFGGLKLTQPFVRSRELNLASSLGIDLRSTDNRSDIDITRHDDITSVRLGGHLDFVDTLFAAAYTNTNIELSRGINALGASNKGATDLSRAAGDPTYTKITADITRLERLYGPLALQTGIKGQMSNGALLSAEEFGLGGASNIGRGYDPSEIVGDDGFAGSVELQWASPVPVGWVDSYTVYGFYDIGKVWNDDSSATLQEVQSLASVGLGLRAEVTDATQASFMVAKPLTREVAAHNDDNARFYFSVSHDF